VRAASAHTTWLEPLRRLGYIALTAVPLMVFSEELFWARPGPWSTAREFLPTFLAYALATSLFLTTVACFRVRSAAALILAGAVYGWFLEGVIVQTMYDDFPLNLSFTGLAWHAPFSVMLGWVILPVSLSGHSIRRTLGLAAALGAGYGMWSLWWWTIEPPAAAPLAFTVYTLSLTLLLMASYSLAPRLGLTAFRPSRVEIVVLLGLTAAWFLIVTLPSQPLALIVLPPLAAILLTALIRNRRCEARPDQIQVSLARRPPGIPHLLSLLALPATASAIYLLAAALGSLPPTGILLYLISVPLGFGLLVWALVTTARLRFPDRPPDPALGVIPPAAVP
jgi:hypothetical protein